MNEGNSQISRFIAALATLDAGELARLKRNAGRMVAEARDNALGIFYRILPANTPASHEDTYFMLATLYPLAEDGQMGSVGHALRQARGDSNSAGLDRRMAALLDSDDEQLRYRLGQAVRYLASQDVAVNWERLLSDLLHWNHPDRYVQRAWARAYYAGQSESSGTAPANETER